MADDLESKVSVSVDAKVTGAGQPARSGGTNQPVRIAAMDRAVTDSLANALAGAMAKAATNTAPLFAGLQVRAAAMGTSKAAEAAQASAVQQSREAAARIAREAREGGKEGGKSSRSYAGEARRDRLAALGGHDESNPATVGEGSDKAAAAMNQALSVASKFGGVVTSVFRGVTSTIHSAVGALTSMQARLTGLVGAAGVTALGYMSLRAAGQVQTLALNFEGALGSAGAAALAVGRFQEATTRFPIALASLVQLNQAFLGIGQSAERAGEMTRTAMLLAAGSFGPFDQAATQVGSSLARLGLAADASVSDILQFQAKGIPVIKLLEEHLTRSGKTVRGSILGMAERGELSGREVRGALEAGASRYADLLDKRSKSLEGMWTRISGATQNLFARAGEKVALYFDVEGTQARVLGFLGTVTNGVGVLDGILARLGGVFQGVRDVALGVMESMAATLGGAGGKFQDLKDVGESWRVATVEALISAGKGFIALEEVVVNTFRTLVDWTGRAVTGINNVWGAIANPGTTLFNLGAGGLSTATFGASDWLLGTGKTVRGVGPAADAAREAAKPFSGDAQRKALDDLRGGGKGGQDALSGPLVRDLQNIQGALGMLGQTAKNLGLVPPFVAAQEEATKLQQRMQDLEVRTRSFQFAGETATETMAKQMRKLQSMVSEQKGLGANFLRDQDVTALKSKAFETLTGSLSPFLAQQVKVSGAAQRYSTQAYSAEVAFRQEGRLDPAERIAKAQDAQLTQQKKMADLLDKILDYMKDGGVAVIPTRP